jgi:acyl carrier protein
MTNVETSDRDVASQLRGIWEEVLRVPVAEDADFFDLGGDSLMAVRIVTRVRERLGVDLSALDVFDAPAVPEFISVVRSALQET